MTMHHVNNFAENETYKAIISNFEIIRGRVIIVAVSLFMDLSIIIDWTQNLITSWIIFKINNFEVTDFVFINFEFQISDKRKRLILKNTVLQHSVFQLQNLSWCQNLGKRQGCFQMKYRKLLWLDKTCREEIIFNIISLVGLWRVSGYHLLSTGLGAHPSKLDKPTSKIVWTELREGQVYF